MRRYCDYLELECQQLRRHNEYLEVSLRDNEQDSRADYVISKNGKAYKSEIRLLVYSELLCDVPVNNCGCLLNCSAKVFCGKSLKNVPCPATCAQMAYELGTLTTLQVMEYMLSSKTNLCLSWDATTIDGQHVNEILPTFLPTRLCSSTAGSNPPRRIAIFVYAVHHVSMLHPSTVPGRLAISYVAFP